ncbi:ABC transporter ATP-binding protein [Campylobacter suis]|uniref:Vitamin B12 import ATP-binding protein BtuD n=1 Tax=Campylobacter suis TaxID=2790657 RepID=A0ABN7K7P0_9BACT|nr:ATP-binding cassette domain-containing protein [Campylobacter suis]CAD7286900.1 Vitamin B12 import ATP-binding protein BtuD [Campylobacter suis]
MLILENLEYEILRDRIVRDFSLSLEAGYIVTLFGPSGCGKTTILRLITGLNEPKRGKILNSFKKTRYLFQENRLLEHKNALENIRIANKDKSDNEILAFLAVVGLAKKDAMKYPSELSGGMRARVSFVRALIGEPDLLLMDEPFSGLDVDMREILMSEILSRVELGMSIVLVTHDRFEAVRLSDEILFLSQKGMHVEQNLSLKIPQKERDFAFVSRVIDEKFASRIYFD